MKSQLQFVLTFAIALIALVGCGTNSDPKGGSPQAGGATSTKLNGSDYVFVDKGSLVSTESTLSGTGSVIFRDPLAKEDNNFSLVFTLKDNGALTLSASTDTQLKNGVNFQVKRQGERLKVVLTVGSKTDDLSADFLPLKGSEKITLSIDIHGHGHLMVDGVGQDSLEYVFPKGLTGKLWGLSLIDASVSEAKADKAKHQG